MKKILVTGSNGFIGRNLCSKLKIDKDIELLEFDLNNTLDDLKKWVEQADVIYHLAGINRPKDDTEFNSGNVTLTEILAKQIVNSKKTPRLILSSSIQADLDNPYGKSKLKSEKIVATLSKKNDAAVSIYRLKNVFGKWSKPNYNSVVATFCHNIARDLPIDISNVQAEIDLVYIDDVVSAMLSEMENKNSNSIYVSPDLIKSHRISLGELAQKLNFFRKMQETLQIPNFGEPFDRQLYATYLSYVPPQSWEYGPDVRADTRGDLAELLKSQSFGQIFVSRTHPGIVRGNHFHETKVEKFIVIKGTALIRFRQINSEEVIEFQIEGVDYRIVDIPPGYTHSIENVGDDELITLFWASEIFNPEAPDTNFMSVLNN